MINLEKLAKKLRRLCNSVKEKILDLIKTEALSSEKGAEILLEDIYWLSASHVMKDKVFAIELLMLLKKLHPNLSYAQKSSSFSISQISSSQR